MSVNYTGSVVNDGFLFDCDTVQRAIAKLNIGEVPGVDGVMMTFYNVNVGVQ